MNKRWNLAAAISVAVTMPVWGQVRAAEGENPAADLGRAVRERQFAWREARPSPAQAWLNQQVENVHFDETSLEDVIQWLREQPGPMNVVVRWRVLEDAGVDRETLISLNLRDVPLTDRMQAIIDALIETVEPESWVQNGGQGTATSVRDVIIINNSISVHEKIGGAVRLQSVR